MGLENFKRHDFLCPTGFHFCYRKALKWQFWVWSLRKPTRVWNNSKRWIQEKNEKLTEPWNWIPSLMTREEEKRWRLLWALATLASHFDLENFETLSKLDYVCRINIFAYYFTKQPVGNTENLLKGIISKSFLGHWTFHTWFFFYLLISPLLTPCPSATLAFFSAPQRFLFMGHFSQVVWKAHSHTSGLSSNITFSEETSLTTAI